ncbi:MAG: hypothetical protein ACYDHX_16500 [Methanothrix sp.]
MGILARLIKAVIGAVLLNKAVRNAFIVTLIKSVKWTLRPSTRSRIMAFFTNQVKSTPGSSRYNFLTSLFKGAAELALLRFAKRSGIFGPAALSALAALLLATMRGREENSGTSCKRQKDQVIDIDEYTILDDRH